MALINLRNALMAGKRLPYDAEVEYLQSDGNAYIIAPNNIFYGSAGSKINVTMSTGTAIFHSIAVVLSAGPSIYSSPFYFRVNTDGATQLACPGEAWNTLFGDGAVHTITTTAEFNTRNELVVSADVDGTAIYSKKPTTDSLVFGSSVGFFATNSGNGKCPNGVRLYGITAFDANGFKTADFIPVRKGTVGYLYDRVSGKLFGNAGTGAFTYGNDLKYPIPAS